MKATIKRLAYHADNGAWYSVANLEPGESAVAKQDESAARRLEAAITGEFGRSYAVPVGAYVARLESNPFGDDLGLEPTRLGKVHYLLGVLEQGEVR